MTSDREVVIEVFGEGKTDVGTGEADPPVQRPTKGVVPILLHTLCDKPSTNCSCEPSTSQRGTKRAPPSSWAYPGQDSTRCSSDMRSRNRHSATIRRIVSFRYVIHNSINSQI